MFKNGEDFLYLFVAQDIIKDQVPKVIQASRELVAYLEDQ